MYYEDVEEGFELAQLDKESAIASQGCNQFELRHVMHRLQSHEARADVEIGVASFRQELFAYITSIVPFWRVTDDAWLLCNESHVSGIGVLRNYGGDVLVVPWSDDPELARSLQLPRMANELPDIDRRIVVVDDRSGERTDLLGQRISPIPVILWSERSRLSDFVIMGAPGP